MKPDRIRVPPLILFRFVLAELTEILSKSEDPEELKYYWTQWYDKAGTPVRSLFDKYVELNKEAAVLNSKRFTSDFVRFFFILHFFFFNFRFHIRC